MWKLHLKYVGIYVKGKINFNWYHQTCQKPISGVWN